MQLHSLSQTRFPDSGLVLTFKPVQNHKITCFKKCDLASVLHDIDTAFLFLLIALETCD